MVFASILVPPNARGIIKTPTPRFAKGKTVVISRTYHPSQEPHGLGVVTAQINNFAGVKIGDTLFLGGGHNTSPVVDIKLTLDASRFQVYRCKTETGSYYEVIAIS